MENVKNIENSRDKVSQKNNVKYREDGCLQPPSPSISLTDDQTIVDLDGYHVSVGDLKEHVIDSHIYREHIRQLMRNEEVKA